MIRTHKDDPPLTTVEAARIARITALAMIRGGILTTAQQNTIDRILDGARKRAEQAAAAAAGK
ncbi:DUF6257 family protein [Actinacidiphila acididurans]|uniref:Uncharacterized protein n=1 Tax=Actinacidiphila acididurans TaxID=2784346 RepID=A0ABS2TNY0_9ACTN|nr:DUF6257 family protein [Actinacidiphila acididurans]MBM9505045.1 hypothetical protein [Actinacidiphila acididurans]